MLSRSLTIYMYTQTSPICDNSVSTLKFLKVLKCYNFLWVRRRHNCSPVVSFANCVMTPYLLKLLLPVFLSIPVTQKCQILSCDTLFANERYVRGIAMQCPVFTPQHTHVHCMHIHTHTRTHAHTHTHDVPVLMFSAMYQLLLGCSIYLIIILLLSPNRQLWQ
jgi:hypothetical protein